MHSREVFEFYPIQKRLKTIDCVSAYLTESISKETKFCLKPHFIIFNDFS